MEKQLEEVYKKAVAANNLTAAIQILAIKLQLKIMKGNK